MTIKHLVISGGAYKGFYTVGAIKYLSDIDFYDINNIENIYGTSVGALIGLLICLKLDWNDIIEHIINRPWQKLFNFSPEDLFELFNKKGLMKKNFIFTIFDTFLKNSELTKDSTLKDIYEYSKINLHLYSVNLSTFELIDFSYKTYPNMKVLDAVYMSCSIPFAFQPNLMEGDYYVDGGVINPYPLNLCLKDLKNMNESNSKYKEEILAFKIIDDVLEPSKESSNIVHFGFYLFYRLIKENYNYSIEENMPNELIIHSAMLNMKDMEKIINEPETRRKMVEDGKKYAQLFLSYKQKNNS